MMEEVENRPWNCSSAEEEESGALWKRVDTTRPSNQSLPSFVNNILAVFTGSVARKSHTFQCCAVAQHKSSAVINEHSSAHVGASKLSIHKHHASSLINKSVESLVYHLNQRIAADSFVRLLQTG